MISELKKLSLHNEHVVAALKARLLALTNDLCDGSIPVAVYNITAGCIEREITRERASQPSNPYYF